jgi:hypothetical protein
MAARVEPARRDDGLEQHWGGFQGHSTEWEYDRRSVLYCVPGAPR